VCETWFFTLNQLNKLKVFENKIMGKILNCKEVMKQENEKNCLVRTLIFYTPQRVILSGHIKVDGMRWTRGICVLNRSAYRVLRRFPKFSKRDY
jgi:hypothetical protein